MILNFTGICKTKWNVLNWTEREETLVFWVNLLNNFVIKKNDFLSVVCPRMILSVQAKATLR